MKKMLLFLMAAIPVMIILIVKLTASVTVGDVFVSVENITLNQTEISPKVGDSTHLIASILPKTATNKDVVWSSNNEQSAVVDEDGNVDFVGIGSGYITVTTTDGNKSAQCSFYVWDTRVHKVELNAPKKFVHIGGKIQLNATVLPTEAINKDVEFSSSNEQIATVDSNGLVYGHKEGYVTITATSTDGYYSGVVELLVVNPVTALLVEQNEIVTSSNRIQIEYLIEPFDATYQNVIFEVDDPSIAEVDSQGAVTFKKIGETYVTLTAEDGGFEQTIKLIYTGGYAKELIVESPIINMQVDDAPVLIEYQTLPEKLPMTRVEFSSSDDSIAFVDSVGYIHALQGGSVVITVKVKTDEVSYIEKQIYVNIDSPARGIAIKDGMTAEKTYQLSPQPTNADSTNLDYFYHIENSSLASVSESGLVTFNSQTPCTVAVTIYANKDYSDVFKKVSVTYTAGKAGSFEFVDKNMTVAYGQTFSLNYQILPLNAKVTPTISMNYEKPNVENQKVVEVMGDGMLKAVGGGEAELKVSITLYDGSLVEEICHITVVREAAEIQINLDLDFYNGQYVTANNTVQLNATALPNDATDRDITWTLNKTDIAFLRGNTIIFNEVGSVILTASAGKISNSVKIYYAGVNPVYAEVQANYKDEKVPIPQKISVGESFEIEISKLLPTYASTPTMSIQATNQKTVNILGKALQVDGNTVTGVAGGTATLIVYIANSIRLNFDITVEQKPTSISVLQANTTITSDSVNLISEVLPYDTTNPKVKYVVHETDIASIEGSTLTFKKVGVANITAICEADESVTYDFYIEKIEKSIVYVSLQQSTTTANTGDLLVFQADGEIKVEIIENSPIISGETVARVEGSNLRCLSSGKVLVSIKTQTQTYLIHINVNQLVEKITYIGKADLYNGEYITAKDTFDLDLEILPINAVNKDVNISILSSVSSIGRSEKVATVSGKKVYFNRAGSVTLQIDSVDGNCTYILSLRYTGGEALEAKLNVEDELLLDIGESVTIDVVKWLPFDVENTRIDVYEVNPTGPKVISLNSRTITAVGSGETKLVVQLSSGLVKEIRVICVNKVTDIEIDDNILTASRDFEINALVFPQNATNKNLTYILEKTDIATIDKNVVHFSKPGTVSVTLKTTDGSNLEKTINITCTMGYLGKIVLNKEQVLLRKGENFKILVEKYPLDATYNDVQFKILSQTAFNGMSQVINLASNGQITALCSGKAVVRVFAFDYNNNEVYADCEIEVYNLLDSFRLRFDSSLSQYQNQNTYVTSKTEIPFEISCQPIDATISKFTCDISNSAIAKVEGNKIIFLQKGRVTITFKCYDNTSTEKAMTYTFYYVGDDLIEATLDKTKITNNTINLEAGESFKFALEKVLPGDVSNLNFTIKDYTEKRNDPSKQVAKFENGMLYALNGGSCTFTLYVNGLKLEKLTLNVTRKATDIVISGDTQVYISSPYYTITASVLEKDSYQNVLGFKSNSNIATVTQDGNVTFKDLGECEITVYIVDNPSIFKIIKIKYTKELQAIAFNTVRSSLYVGEYVDLTVYAKPADAKNFEYVMKIDNSSVAQLIKKGDGYRIIGLASGSVTVTASVIGKDISVSKQFVFYEKLKDIKLALDESGDKKGLGEYRVFGNLFFNEKNEVVKTYLMQVSTIPSNIPRELLEWLSSDEDVATVDENGLVTFLKTGKVTITVRQKIPYEGANVATDSYTFTIVDGLNVENYAQFNIAHTYLTNLNKDKIENLSAMVLHNDIHINPSMKQVVFNYNIYGNGYMLDHSEFVNEWTYYIIRRSNIILDNVILRGINFTNGLQLKDTGNTLIIEYCSNVLLYNTIVENAESAVRIQSSNVTVEGCIFRNCLVVGIKVARDEKTVTNLKVKDCIFTSSFSGIMFTLSTFKDSKESLVTLEGEIRFYNWATIDQLEQGLGLDKILNEVGVPFVAAEVFKQMKEIATTKGREFCMEYNGQSYYNFGIVKIKADIMSKTYQASGEVERTQLNSSCNYSALTFSGALNFAIVVPVECSILSLSNSRPFIKPGDTYIGDTALLSRIRKPCRF